MPHQSITELKVSFSDGNKILSTNDIMSQTKNTRNPEQQKQYKSVLTTCSTKLSKFKRKT